MNRSMIKNSLLWLIILLVVFSLAACGPNTSILSETTEDEAPVTVTSSSPADVTEEAVPSRSETTAETSEETETIAVTTETTTEPTKETAKETAAETTEATTAKPAETTAARPTVTTAPTAAPTPTPEPAPVAIEVSLAVYCRIATEAGLAGAPASGIILAPVTTKLGAGETVFDVLIRVGKDEGIAVASRGSGAYAFITGIAGLTAVNAKSGWVYSVNGEFASIGSGAYKLSPGDVIEWHYTMDTGNDL